MPQPGRPTARSAAGDGQQHAAGHRPARVTALGDGNAPGLAAGARRPDLLQLAAELSARREAFAIATVVRREAPSSAQVGDTAVVASDGTFRGWLGGSCTHPTVLREAMRALSDRQPRLIALLPPSLASPRAGVEVFPMTCHSGGSVEIFIQPVLPSPRLVVFGDAPVAHALVNLAKAMGLAVDVVDPDADPGAVSGAVSGADRVFTRLDAAELRPSGTPSGDRPYAVVATMGQYDEDAVLAALSLDPAYLGVIASRRRFEQIRDAIADRVPTRDRLDRIKCPAGLDIGARSPDEIAISILAEMIEIRRLADRAPSRASEAAPSPTLERDPVCGMMVAVTEHALRTESAGHIYYFCGGGCRTRFLAEPTRFAAAPITPPSRRPA